MNDTQPQSKKKDSILKSLAIVGFLGIIIFIAWLSVQLVGVIPGAFSSLASLAEGLNQNQAPALDGGEMTSLTVTSNTTLVTAGESVVVSWGTTNEPGSYVFSYKCAEGVAIDIIEDDNRQSIACDTDYDLGGNSSVSLGIDSEKARYADVNYSISFLAAGDDETLINGSSSLTIINSEIFDVLVSTTSEEGPVPAPEVAEEVDESKYFADEGGILRDRVTGEIVGNIDAGGVIRDVETGEIIGTFKEGKIVMNTEEPAPAVDEIAVAEETESETAEEVTVSVETESEAVEETVVEVELGTGTKGAVEPTITVATNETGLAYEQEYTYTIPVSDPNGRTDLATKYLNTGTIVGNIFFPGQIKRDEDGAIQFEVKNIGTKTTGPWLFSVSLPDGSLYTSPIQTPLKPNERAILTVGFPTNNDTSHNFVVTVAEATDRNTINNQFSQNVSFLK